MNLDLLRSLREMGVKRVHIDTGQMYDVEFFPAVAAPDGLPLTPKDLGEGPERCRCGHDETEHAGGGCLFGCKAEECAEKQTP